MKKLTSSIVLVKQISSTVSDSFSKDEIEQAALSILKMGGTIRPMIIRRTGIESFELVEGTKTYLAAKRAREINPLDGETINVFIIENDDENELFEEQIKIYTHSKECKISTKTNTNSTDSLKERVKKMGKISHSIVMVKNIISSDNFHKGNYSEQKIDEIAVSILSVGGLIRPLILKEVGLFQYELIEGGLEYYGVLRAGEIDALGGETINAFIAQDDEEVQAYKEQLLNI